MSRALRGSSAPSSIGTRVRMHPLALAESGWVWVGADSRPAGFADGAGHTWPAPRRGPAGPAEHAPREGGRRPPL